MTEPLIEAAEIDAILDDITQAWEALASVAMQVPGAAETIGPRAKLPPVIGMVFDQAKSARSERGRSSFCARCSLPTPRSCAHPLCPQICAKDVCRLASSTGVKCANDECDIATGARQSPDKQERPNDLQEWIWHMDLHLTEHDERHAGLALRAAWPVVRAYLYSVENERNTWRELAKKAESAPSASARNDVIEECVSAMIAPSNEYCETWNDHIEDAMKRIRALKHQTPYVERAESAHVCGVEGFNSMIDGPCPACHRP